MKYIYYIAVVASSLFFCSCSSSRSGAEGITNTEINTYVESINRYDLDVDPQGITYTIDISTQEGRIKLNGLSLEEAKNLALEEAAIKNNCARIVSPKYSHLMEHGDVLRITVFGFPARYKNSQKTATPDKEQPSNNVIIVR